MNDKSDDVTARLRQGFNARGEAPELSPELVSAAGSRPAPRLVNQQRRAVLAGGATLAVAAVTVGALVVSTPFKREPLFQAGAAQGGGAQESSTMGDGVASSDLRIAPWVQYKYKAGAGLSTSGGSGSVYELKRVGSPEDVASTVAKYFGVEGKPVKPDYFDAKFPSFVVGSQDGTGKSVNVTWMGTGDWWYNNSAAYPAYEECFYEEEIAATGEKSSLPSCEVVQAEALKNSKAPGEAEARAEALDIFTATGLDVSANDIDVTADDYQTTATAALEVDGQQTALTWSISWSQTGEIAWASGHSIEVVDRGDFPTVSATDAVDRLDDYRWYGAAGLKYQGGYSTMAAEGVARDGGMVADGDTSVSSDGDIAEAPPTDPATGGGTDGNPGTDPVEPTEPTEPTEPEPAPEPEPSEEPYPEPAPSEIPDDKPLPDPEIDPLPEPMPTEPEVVEVTVDEAEATLLLMWDADGNAWLVPGFAMQQPEGWYNSVVSLEEGVIELPKPMEIEPMIEPMPTEDIESQ